MLQSAHACAATDIASREEEEEDEEAVGDGREGKRSEACGGGATRAV